jgi:hypothetical protein
MTRGTRSLGWQCFLEQVITERNRRPVHIYHPYEWRHVINPLPVAPAWLLEDIRTRRRQPQGGQARGGYGCTVDDLRGKVDFYPEPIPLNASEAYVDAVVKHAKRKGYGLIVIDTWATANAGSEVATVRPK